MLRKLSWMAFFVGLFAIILLSVIPVTAIPKLGLPLPEILSHMAAYAALALAGGIACRSARSLFMLASGLLLLGVGLEFVQALLPSRDASGYELLANVAGVALGFAAAILTNTLIKKCPQILG